MVDVYGQFYRWTVDESAANTLTVGNGIATGAMVQPIDERFLALEIHHVMGSISTPDNPSGANDETISNGVISTRDTLTALPVMSDNHVIYKTQRLMRSGLATYEPLIIHDAIMPPFTQFDPPVLVSHTFLYPYVKGVGNTNTKTFNGYLFGNLVLLEGALIIEALESYR